MNPEYAIDLSKVLEKKNIRLPRFVVKRLEKFLCIDFINKAVTTGGNGMDFCNFAMKYLDISATVEGLENIPVDGTKYTFASNHPLGGCDSVILMSIIGNRFGGNLRVPMNDFVQALKPLQSMCIPINKTGAQSRNLPAVMDSAFASDNHILIFPAGLCSRLIDGKIQDLPWKKTFVAKSIQSGRTIVPVHFEGQNSRKFYRVAKICKALGFKFNFAMAYLPQEMVKGQHSHYTIKFGTPIPPSALDNSKSALEWAADIRQRVYNL